MMKQQVQKQLALHQQQVQALNHQMQQLKTPSEQIQTLHQHLHQLQLQKNSAEHCKVALEQQLKGMENLEHQSNQQSHLLKKQCEQYQLEKLASDKKCEELLAKNSALEKSLQVAQRQPGQDSIFFKSLIQRLVSESGISGIHKIFRDMSPAERQKLSDHMRDVEDIDAELERLVMATVVDYTTDVITTLNLYFKVFENEVKDELVEKNVAISKMEKILGDIKAPPDLATATLIPLKKVVEGLSDQAKRWTGFQITESTVLAAQDEQHIV